MKNFFLIISIIFSLNLFAKISDLDKQLLISTESSKKQLFKDRNVKFGLGKNNYLADYTFGSLMYIYQKYLSVQVSSSCLYNPTCSVYSKMLFERYGVFKGIFITADRITRCDRMQQLILEF